VENAVFTFMRFFRRAAMRVQIALFLIALVALPTAPALAVAGIWPAWTCLAGPALLALAYAWGLAWRRLVEARFRAWSARMQETEPCSPESSRP